MFKFISSYLLFHFLIMVASLLVSVVTATNSAGVVYQKVYINDPDGARAAAARFEEQHRESFYKFDWFITVRDY